MSREVMQQMLSALETLMLLEDEDCGLKECKECQALRPIWAAMKAGKEALDAPLYRRGTIVRCLESDELATVYTTSLGGDAWVKWPDGSIGVYTAEQMGKAFAIEPKWQEPEPVWIQSNHLDHARREPSMCRVEPTQRLPDFVPLYPAPREWQGLTEIEICDLEVQELPSASSETFSFARAIEAKLKEKNT